jgi:hypothetical protein
MLNSELLFEAPLELVEVGMLRRVLARLLLQCALDHR